jgi:hypothetical protein
MIIGRLGTAHAGWTWVATRLLLLILILALLAADGAAVLEAMQPEVTEDIIVVLPDNADVPGILRRFDVRPTHRYRHVVNGFSAEVPPGVRRALEQIPGAVISPNRRVTVAERVTSEAKRCKKRDKRKKRCQKRGTTQPLPVQVIPTPVAPTPVSPTPSTQVLPTGIRRIAVDRNPQAAIHEDGGMVAVDVAVLDTGIAPHPDLTRASTHDCTGQGPDDGSGHGTHVAGIIGARDNTFGVVGVAPGAPLYSVKVLNNDGSGTEAALICGLEWVAANASVIDVVNASISGAASAADQNPCGPTTSAIHNAVCDVVLEHGIAVVTAAGNNTADAATRFPATYDEVITVSALTDFDGRPGGQTTSTCYADADDTFARFSNYGADVDIAAPGTCIFSTWLGGGYDTRRGTSFAAPHVTGAVALYLETNPTATPAQVQAYLLGAASRPQQSPEGLVIDDDPDAIPEPVLYIP